MLLVSRDFVGNRWIERFVKSIFKVRGKSFFANGCIAICNGYCNINFVFNNNLSTTNFLFDNC